MADAAIPGWAKGMMEVARTSDGMTWTWDQQCEVAEAFMDHPPLKALIEAAERMNEIMVEKYRREAAGEVITEEFLAALRQRYSALRTALADFKGDSNG